jgi:hypothetical protein
MIDETTSRRRLREIVSPTKKAKSGKKQDAPREDSSLARVC